MNQIHFIREKKERDYTVVDNTFLKDVSLSWKAKGLFCYLLSLPEDWKIHLAEIEQHAPDGRDSLRSAVNELKQAGYLEVSTTRDERGVITGSCFKIIEKPAAERKTRTTENPPADKNEGKTRTTEKPSDGKSETTKYLNNKIPKEQNTNAGVCARDGERDASRPDESGEGGEKKERMRDYLKIKDEILKNGIEGQFCFSHDIEQAKNDALEKVLQQDTRPFETILRECLLLRLDERKKEKENVLGNEERN